LVEIKGDQYQGRSQKSLALPRKKGNIKKRTWIAKIQKRKWSGVGQTARKSDDEWGEAASL
jgi:hypothetical protein